MDSVRQALDAGRKPVWANIGKLIARSGDATLHRWLYSLDPTLKRGPWTLEEDVVIRKHLGAAASLGVPLPATMVGRMLSRPRDDVRYRWRRLAKEI